MREIVPAARTVLLDGLDEPGRLAVELPGWEVPPVATRTQEAIEIPVRYDGPDLPDVAALWGVPETEVARIHSAADFRVAFCGFAPGFGYLTGLPPAYDVPRRPTPRTAVPAGSVALAGPYTGVYPRASPGGWQLIGTTDVVLWDHTRVPASLLSPGARVRLVPVTGRGTARWGRHERPRPRRRPPRGADHRAGPRAARPRPPRGAALGRPGRARGGPRQPPGRQSAGRGGPGDDARRLCRATTGDGHRGGGRRPLPGLGGRPSGALGCPVPGAGGALLDIGAARSGVRAYVAVSGGVAVESVLGSRSTDLLSGLGPPPLTAGAVLPLGRPVGAPARVDLVPQPAPPAELVLRVTLGPREDWFTVRAVRTFTTRAYRVSSASNRIGLRTEGPALERALSGELPSEGMVLGAVQVPPDGHPVVFLADHPTTGGYPVLAVVRPADLPAAAQAAPGTPVRFVAVRHR